MTEQPNPAPEVDLDAAANALDMLTTIAGMSAHNLRASLAAIRILRPLISEVRSLRGQKPEWVTCSERMPQPDTMVLFISGGQLCVGMRRSNRGPYSPWDDLLVVDMCGDCDHYNDDEVTHWMPLPSTP